MYRYFILSACRAASGAIAKVLGDEALDRLDVRAQVRKLLDRLLRKILKVFDGGFELFDSIRQRPPPKSFGPK
jgi:hypothetical protein